MPTLSKQPLVLLSCLFLFTASLLTTPVQADARADILQAANPEQSGEYVRQRFLSKVEQPFDPKDSRKKMLIIGDSHAQDFYNALAENNIEQRYQVSTRRIPGMCGLYLGTEDISRFIERKHIPNCQASDTLARALPAIKQADVVILAANWTQWSVERLPTTIQNLQIKAPQKLFVVGRKDFGKVNLRHYMRLSEADLKQLRNPVLGAQHDIIQIMRRVVPQTMLVDVQSLVCRSETDCPLFTPQARLISFDGGHLTQEGAKYIGRLVLQHAPLNQL